MKSDIAQVISAASDYINLRENSNTDSQIVACVPKGTYVKILSDPIDGTVDHRPEKWYKVTFNNVTGYHLVKLTRYICHFQRNPLRTAVRPLRMNLHGLFLSAQKKAMDLK